MFEQAVGGHSSSELFCIFFCRMQIRPNSPFGGSCSVIDLLLFSKRFVKAECHHSPRSLSEFVYIEDWVESRHIMNLNVEHDKRTNERAATNTKLRQLYCQ